VHSRRFPVLKIRRVTADGTAQDLGEYDHNHKRLTLGRHGYPLLGPGEHLVNSSLPWVLEDMTPSGYIGRGIAMIAPPALPADPKLWRDEHRLHVLQQYGDHLTGNILVGEHGPSGWIDVEDFTIEREGIEALIKQTMNATYDSSSSAGGDQPKMVLFRSIVKFSPAAGSPYYERWSDLLIVEQHCLHTLGAHGIPAATAQTTVGDHRTWLSVDRFDRVGKYGRRGAVTWTWLDADLYGSGDAAKCAAHLHADGHLSDGDFEHFQRAHLFSAAIGNNDTHLGNYGLLFDDDGRAQLAPLYDVLPMAFAPTFDGLPVPRSAQPVADPKVVAMVDDLAGRIVNDLGISADFKAQWMRHVGR
jgi:HipA-like C-terminal domain